MDDEREKRKVSRTKGQLQKINAINVEDLKREAEDYPDYPEIKEKFESIEKPLRELKEFIAEHADTLAILYGTGAEGLRYRFLEILNIRDCEAILTPERMGSKTPEGMELREALSRILAERPRTQKEKELRYYDFGELLDMWELVALYEAITPQTASFLPSSPHTTNLSKALSALSNGHVPVEAKITTGKNGQYCFSFVSENAATEITIVNREYMQTLFGKSRGNSGDARKLLAYILVKCNEKKTNPFHIDLRDMVKDGLYSRTDAARRGFIDNIKIIMDGLDLRAITANKDGKVTKTGAKATRFITAYELPADSPIITIHTDPTGEITAALSQYYAACPRWAFDLSQNAFALTQYIYTQGRQNGDSLNDKGYYNMSFEKIRQNMGLPDPAECSNARAQIKKPIEKAITEIEATAKKHKDNTIVLTPWMPAGGDATKARIKDWLRYGMLRVELRGFYLEYNQRRANSKQAAKEKATRRTTGRKKRKTDGE